MNFRTQPRQTNKITGIKGYEAEPLEGEIRRLMNNDGKVDAAMNTKAEKIYTERKDGVISHFNIRTDKWEEWADTMDKASELHAMQREVRQGERNYDKMTADEQKSFNEKYPNNSHARAAKMGGDL